MSSKHQSALIRANRNGSAPWWVYVSRDLWNGVKGERNAHGGKYERIEQEDSRPKRLWLNPRPGKVYVCMVHAPGQTKEDGVVVCKTEQTALLHYLVLMCGLRPGSDTRSAVDALLHRVKTTANAQAAADCEAKHAAELAEKATEPVLGGMATKAASLAAAAAATAGADAAGALQAEASANSILLIGPKDKVTPERMAAQLTRLLDVSGYWEHGNPPIEKAAGATTATATMAAAPPQEEDGDEGVLADPPAPARAHAYGIGDEIIYMYVVGEDVLGDKVVARHPATVHSLHDDGDYTITLRRRDEQTITKKVAPHEIDTSCEVRSTMGELTADPTDVPSALTASVLPVVMDEFILDERFQRSRHAGSDEEYSCAMRERFATAFDQLCETNLSDSDVDIIMAIILDEASRNAADLQARIGSKRKELSGLGCGDEPLGTWLRSALRLNRTA